MSYKILKTPEFGEWFEEQSARLQVRIAYRLAIIIENMDTLGITNI